jgi:hypothetical protein
LVIVFMEDEAVSYPCYWKSVRKRLSCAATT